MLKKKKERKGSSGIEIDKQASGTEYRVQNLIPLPPKCENL